MKNIVESLATVSGSGAVWTDLLNMENRQKRRLFLKAACWLFYSFFILSLARRFLLPR